MVTLHYKVSFVNMNVLANMNNTLLQYLFIC